jgi:spore coat protein U-like protein
VYALTDEGQTREARVRSRLHDTVSRSTVAAALFESQSAPVNQAGFRSRQRGHPPSSRFYSQEMETMRDLHCLSKTLAIAALATAAVSAQAQTTATDTFQVKIAIQGVCQISSITDIDFGERLSAASTYTQSGTIQVQCTNGLPFTLGLDGGTVAGDVNNRAMQSVAGTQIPYTLSNISYGGATWGNDATSWVSGTGLGIGAGYALSFTVYGQATVTGTEPVGQYLDTVTATITY